jgi:hypothetical protein
MRVVAYFYFLCEILLTTSREISYKILRNFLNVLSYFKFILRGLGNEYNRL